uniref:Uncharacterized protein n=1 Tax=Oryza sativa subsp. japonica TaxID=39947 RepID=Q6ZI92_ORYSJ|nr:hypothetical protein [Oryza sativa Japonica Group]BAD33315.1 hypothetical protein [Oryza sativa Japonica Group]
MGDDTVPRQVPGLWNVDCLVSEHHLNLLLSFFAPPIAISITSSKGPSPCHDLVICLPSLRSYGLSLPFSKNGA